MASITRELNIFLDRSDAIIRQLSSSEITENSQWVEQMTEGDSNYTSFNAYVSYESNMEVSNQINELRSLAEKINTLLHIQQYLIQGCSVKKINTHFDGEAIKQSENAEWKCNFTNTFLPGHSSYATSQAIADTCKKIKTAETQALALYNYLNPDNPREISSCCRECVIL